MKFIIILLLLINLAQAQESKEKLILPEIVSDEVKNETIVKDEEKIKLLYDDPVFNGCKTKTGTEYDACIEKVIKTIPTNKKKSMLEEKGIKYQGEANFDLKLSPAGIKLRDFLYKRLQKNLTGETDDPNDKNKPKKIVDPKYFFQLYHLQIQNSIIMTISEYCMEADENFVTPDSAEEREQNRKNNLERLTKAAQENPNSSVAFENFSKCMINIKNICEGENTSSESPKVTETPSENNNNNIKPENETIVKKNESACATLNKIREMRDKIAINSKQKEKFLKEFENTSKNEPGSAADPNLIYDGTKNDEKDTLDLTTISTKEFSDNSEAGNTLNQDSKNFDKNCVDSENKTECLQMTFTDDQSKDHAKMIREYQLRTQFMAEKIRNYTEEELKKHLEKEGRSEKEIAELMLKQKDIKAEISRQYQAERDAYIAKLSKDLEENTLRKNSRLKIDGTPTDKIVKIHNSLAEKPERIKQIIFFSNVINSYFPWKTEGSNKTEYQTGSLYNELENSSLKGNNEVEKIKNLARMQGKEKQEKTKEEKTGMNIDFIHDIILRSYTNPTPKNDQAK